MFKEKNVIFGNKLLKVLSNNGFYAASNGEKTLVITEEKENAVVFLYEQTELSFVDHVITPDVWMRWWKQLANGDDFVEISYKSEFYNIESFLLKYFPDKYKLVFVSEVEKQIVQIAGKVQHV